MKYCRSCVEYQRFYLRGTGRFYSCLIGYCEKKKKVIEREKACECWKQRPPVNTEIKKQEVYAAIVNAAEYLAQLKQIVEEDFQKGDSSLRSE